ERLLHARRARVAEDRARAEGARAELHAALEPAERLAFGEGAGALADDLLVGEDIEHRAGGAQAPLDLGGGEFRPEIAAAHAVERYAAREAKIFLTSFSLNTFCELEDNLLRDGLDRGGEVHLALRQPLLGLARRPAEQRVELAVGHAQAGAVVEVLEVEAEAA